ncbi:MAG: hypothetical protein ACLFVZ_11480 [Actinomycetota bacterium]
MDAHPGDIRYGYAQTTMLRIVADLIPLFDSPKGEHGIVGGDFCVDILMLMLDMLTSSTGVERICERRSASPTTC